MGIYSEKGNDLKKNQKDLFAIVERFMDSVCPIEYDVNGQDIEKLLKDKLDEINEFKTKLKNSINARIKKEGHQSDILNVLSVDLDVNSRHVKIHFEAIDRFIETSDANRYSFDVYADEYNDIYIKNSNIDERFLIEFLNEIKQALSYIVKEKEFIRFFSTLKSKDMEVCSNRYMSLMFGLTDKINSTGDKIGDELTTNIVFNNEDIERIANRRYLIDDKFVSVKDVIEEDPTLRKSIISSIAINNSFRSYPLGHHIYNEAVSTKLPQTSIKK